MKYGQLTIIGSESKDGRLFWICECDCGNEKSIYADSIKKGATRSCGCLRKAVTSNLARTHGMYATPEHRAWRQMIRRCDPDSKDHEYYSDRGITVCAGWLERFENFFADMGMRPSSLHSIDRKDNDKSYSKENCRWATKEEQCQNSSQSKIWTINGISYPSASAAGASLGISEATVRKRCDGRRCGKYYYPPVVGYSSALLYINSRKQ